MTNLKQQWENICDMYLVEFCEKHGYDYQYDLAYGYIWVDGRVGEVAHVGDMFIDMSDIRYDIDNNIPKECFGKWYWEHLDRNVDDIKYINYESFCKELS